MAAVGEMTGKPTTTILAAEDVSAIEAMLAKLPVEQFDRLMEIPEVAEAVSAKMPVLELSEADRGLL